MTLVTKFVNKTTVDFKLKEGNAGVYRDVCILKGLQSETGVPCEYELDFDETATYREYMTVSRGSAVSLIRRFTSARSSA